MTLTHRTLEARNVDKRYGHTHALDSVNITLSPGEVHGLVGHNGAGKSTLLRILSGAERPDSGQLLLDGQPLQLGSPREAIERGISCVYQELSLVEELTVAQNLFLGRELRRGPRLQLAEMERETADFLAEYALSIPPDAKVRSLTVAQRQLIEVITSLHRNAKYLLLDEPTTALEVSQVEYLLDTVRRVAHERGVSVLLVDHKLEEIYAVADRVTAMRNGAIVLSGSAASVKREDVVGVIVGTAADREQRKTASGHALARRPVVAAQAASASATDRASKDRERGPALEVRHLRSENLDDVSLVARAGRVLGVYGLVGSGRTNLLRTVYGAEEMRGGEIRLYGQPYTPRGPEEAIDAGIAYLPEDRKIDGFIAKLTAISNVGLPVLRRFSLLGVLRLGRAADAAEAALDAVDVIGDVRGPMEDLSGGNQQKVLFGRVVLQRPRLLLLDEPTKGVDIGAKKDIHTIIRSLVSGPDVSAIVVSSEEEEILTLSDDIVVFHRGVCDGTVYDPASLQPGDLRRFAWTAGEEPLTEVS